MTLTHFTVQAPAPGYNGFASGAVVTADGVFREHFPRGGIAVATGETPPVGIVPAETPFKIINGVLCDASGSPGVRLKCDQAALGLSTTLQYEASFHNVDVAGKPSSIAGFTFNAQPTDTPLNLLTVTPVASVVAVALGGLLSTQITDATPFGRSLLTAADATTIRNLIDAGRFDFLGVVASQAAMLALSGQEGDWCNRSDLSASFILTGTDPTQLSNWTELSYPAGEPVIAAGTTSQYWRGDKSFQTLNQDVVPDGTTNKAYTAADKTRLAGTSGTNTGDQTSVSGNAGTATKLTTARNINGVAFDGTANVTIPAGATPKFYRVDDYGADPTGVASSDTALASAMTALGANPGTIVFGVGTYKLTVPCPSVFGVRQGVIGQGIAKTSIVFTGTGTLFNSHDPRAYTVTSPGSFDGGVGYGVYGDLWGPFTIDGAGSGAGSVGLEIGDMCYTRGDLCVQNFSGAGSIGVHFINRYTWTEKIEFRILAVNNTQNVKIEGGSGTAVAGTGAISFGYTRFDVICENQPNQDGVVLTNNAVPYNGELRIRGNFVAATSAGANTGVVLKIGEANILNSGVTDNSNITRCHLDIGVETNGNVGAGQIYGPKTIVMSASAGCQLNGYGTLRFWSTGGINFQTGNANGKTAFNGIVDVDTNLGRNGFWQAGRDLGFRGGSTAGISGGVLGLATRGNLVTATLSSGNLTITGIDADADAKAGTGETGIWDILLTQPPSGAAGTVTWPAGFTWLDGSPPTLSTANNAVDHIRVVSSDFTTFYAKHVNRILGESDIPSLTTDLAAKVAKSTLTTKGDMYAASAASTPARLAVGSDGAVLTASAAAANGVAWAAPSNTTVTNNNNGTVTIYGTVANNNNGTVTIS
jgi:hypothetical protein